jgi:hypothetical protein
MRAVRMPPPAPHYPCGCGVNTLARRGTIVLRDSTVAVGQCRASRVEKREAVGPSRVRRERLADELAMAPGSESLALI